MGADRRERFISAINGDTRKFPWPWTKTAEWVLELRKGAQALPTTTEIAEGGPRSQDDIVRGLLQVHQDQQAQVAAAENEARALRMELDTARKQLNQVYQQLQQQQMQMQQMSAQAQQAVQQARAQAEAIQQAMAPEIQKAQQEAATASEEATKARIELARLQQIHEGIRQSVLQYKSQVMQAVSQDPVTLAEAQRIQEEQQRQMQAQQLQMEQAVSQRALAEAAQAAQAQQGIPPQIAAQQGGMVAQAGAGYAKTAAKDDNPIHVLSRAIAGQGERAGYRRALAAQYLAKAVEAGAKSGQGGLNIPLDSPAGQILQKRAGLGL